MANWPVPANVPSPLPSSTDTDPEVDPPLATARSMLAVAGEVTRHDRVWLDPTA